jgi:iron complex outermembrane receptor protein
MIASLGSAAQPVEPVSERDYLAEVPVVLSVSRLPQRLDETPGAVTIIDRGMIRLSGARDVADLLRLVPGFRVTDSFETNTPMGSYHIGLSDYNAQLQVLIDGRSVYSPYLNGATGTGLQAVSLEDIDHIEVHRGSNSAAYGARAFLGTINIVTRSAADSQGGAANVRGGDNDIVDAYLRYGWGDDRATYRLSADQRADQGLAGSIGPDRVSRVNFRGDLNLGRGDQLELRLGQSVISAGVGFEGQYGDAPRTRTIDTAYLQMDWKRNLDVDQDLAIQYSYMQEKTHDYFPYLDPAVPIYFGGPIDAGGHGNSQSLLATHTTRWGPDFRLAWGGELRRESLVSKPRFDTDAEFVTDFSRVFLNTEWRLRQDLILNAGGMFEHSSISGDAFSPRAMLNWHVANGHTLRYGVSRAHRTPSLFEQYARVTYRDLTTGALLLTTYEGTRTVQPENILAREIGYFGLWPALNAEVDVRIFEEEITDYIKEQEDPSGVKYFANREDFRIHGGELQLKVRPWRDAQLTLAHSLTDSTKMLHDESWKGPVSMTGLLFAQRLPRQVDVSLLYYCIDSIQFPFAAVRSPATQRTDVRVAKGMRLGGRRAELSFVVQNLGPAYPDFHPDFLFRRQAFLMLRLED